MNRSSTRSRLIARAASLALAAALLAPAAANADALPLYIGDPTANEKVASGVFLSLGEGNVKRSLSLAAEKRWGNDYMHARYYSPNLGRFMSVDPKRGKVGSSQSWNRYSYALNNPVGNMDPNGEEAVAVTAAGAAGAAASGGGGYALLSTGALGVVVVGGGVAVTHVGSGDGQTTVAEWWAELFQTMFSQRGHRNVRSNEFDNYTDQDLEEELADPNTPPKRKRKLQKEQKGRKQRNKQKRDSGKAPKKGPAVVVLPLTWPEDSPEDEDISEDTVTIPYDPPSPPDED